MNERGGLPARQPIGFLIAQLGAHATERFAARLRPLSLAPADAGVLRLLGERGGISQQSLAGQLGVHPSRMVAMVDDLETRGLLQREENPADRRTYALHLTERGRATLGEVGRIARDNNDALCSGLSDDERATLAGLLGRIAEQQGLRAGIHPGYRPAKPAEG